MLWQFDTRKWELQARFLYKGEFTLWVRRDQPNMADIGRSEYLNMERQWHDRSPYVNQSLFNPEWIYGVCSEPGL